MKKMLYTALVMLALCSCNRKNDYSDLEEQVLYEYLDMFLADAKRHGLDFDYVYDHKIHLHFADLTRGRAGSSYAFNNKRKIKIFIDYNTWHESQGEQGERYKKTLMYHELGHDIMELDHGDGPMLMEKNVKRVAYMKRYGSEHGLSIEERYQYAWDELFIWYKQNR